MKSPRITIVTPSYNQGQFLEDTLRSVLGQEYPTLEYLVMDGGSTDGSVEIIRRHAQRLSYWTSGPDGGQAAAINTAFARAEGDIFCWLNSDDMHLPGALAYAASQLDVDRPEVVFGNCVHLSDGRHVIPGTVPPATIAGSNVAASAAGDLRLMNYVIQPSAFWTRKAWECAGPLDPKQSYIFDWDWMIRAKQAGVEFKPRERYLSVYRIHEAHKTGSGGSRRDEEIAALYDRHAGERYTRLFRACAERRGTLRPLRAWLWRARLGRLDAATLKVLYPSIFHGYSRNEIGAVMSML